MPTKSKKRLTKEQRAVALQKYQEGIPIPQIAEELGVNGQSVSGAISSAKLRRELPPDTPPVSEIPMPSSAPAPSPAPAPAPAPQASAPVRPTAPPILGSPDAFSFRAIAPGGASFNYQSTSTRYIVERIVPNDGLLGTHPHPFEPSDVGRTYGEGVYRITKQEPGRPSQIADLTISSTYGPSKYPGAQNRQGRQENEPRRFRQDWRERYGRESHGERFDEEEAHVGHAPRNPFFNRFARPEPAPAPPSQEPGVATTVVNQMAEMHKATLEQMKTERATGPQSWFQDFFSRTQKEQNQQRDFDRQRDEERRREEREREEQRRADENLRWERQQKAERERHQQDMERVRQDYEHRAKIEREQRQTILEIEQKRIDVIQQEHKNRETLFQRELERTREDMSKIQERTTEDMAGLQQSIEERLSKEREQLQREHDLRQKALDNEHALRTEILKIREETSSKSDNDAIVKMLEKIVGEVGKNVKEVVELKKLEVLTPEAQAAAVHARASEDGNVVEPVTETPNPRMAQPAPVQSGAPANGNGNGHGEQTRVPNEKEGRMDRIIQDQLKKPFLKEVVKEWALHIKEGCDPTTFVNMFMEWMKDENDGEGRKATAAFVNYMHPRAWNRMLPVLEGALTDPEDAELLEIFRTQDAEEYYKGFRSLVVNATRDFWLAYAEQKKISEQVGQGAAAAPVSVPAQPVAAVPPPAAPATEEAENEETPVADGA